MNFDEFERDLSRRQLRAVPAEWRTQIFRAASREQTRSIGAQTPFSWRELLWPCPQAWAGLAALWVLILALNATPDDSALDRTTQAQSGPPSPQLRLALQMQRQLRAELMELSTATSSQEAETPRPRSDAKAHNFKASFTLDKKNSLTVI